MGRRKAHADCRADTRGGRFAGIPICVIDSLAYRDLSLWARAILVELVKRMSGYNNGKIALSITEICIALNNSNRGKASKAIAELMEHGFIDVPTEANWKERMAREYRLTFVTTAYPPFGATNDYKNWTPADKSGGNASSPEKAVSGDAPLPVAVSAGHTPLPVKNSNQRKSAKNGKSAFPVSGNAVSPLINNHTHPPKSSSSIDYAIVRDRVREWIDQYGYGGQKILASRSGTAPSALSRFIAGKSSSLPPQAVGRLLAAIGSEAGDAEVNG